MPRQGGQLKLSAGSFNRLQPACQKSWYNRAYRYAELAGSSQVVAETIASIHCTYPQRDVQDEWAWAA